jgi:hypothetical protein
MKYRKSDDGMMKIAKKYPQIKSPDPSSVVRKGEISDGLRRNIPKLTPKPRPSMPAKGFPKMPVNPLKGKIVPMVTPKNFQEYRSQFKNKRLV